MGSFSDIVNCQMKIVEWSFTVKEICQVKIMVLLLIILQSTKCIGQTNIQKLKTSEILSFGEVSMMLRQLSYLFLIFFMRQSCNGGASLPPS